MDLFIGLTQQYEKNIRRLNCHFISGILFSSETGEDS